MISFSKTFLIFVCFFQSSYSFVLLSNNLFPTQKIQKTFTQTPKYYMCSHDDENLSYLEKLNKDKQKKDKLSKLNSIKENISKYIEEQQNNTGNVSNKASKKASKASKKTTDTTDTKKFTSSYNNPIQRISFDSLFLRLNMIQAIYLTSDNDRAVFCLSNGQRFVFYIKNEQDFDLIQKIFKFAPQSVKICIVCDKNLFTDTMGFLYTD